MAAEVFLLCIVAVGMNNGLYYVRCILNVAGTAFEIFHYYVDCFHVPRIPPSPDISKRVIKYHTFQTLSYGDFESVANIVFPFETNFGQRSM